MLHAHGCSSEEAHRKPVAYGAENGIGCNRALASDSQTTAAARARRAAEQAMQQTMGVLSEAICTRGCLSICEDGGIDTREGKGHNVHRRLGE